MDSPIDPTPSRTTYVYGTAVPRHSAWLVQEIDAGSEAGDFAIVSASSGLTRCVTLPDHRLVWSVLTSESLVTALVVSTKDPDRVAVVSDDGIVTVWIRDAADPLVPWARCPDVPVWDLSAQSTRPHNGAWSFDDRFFAVVSATSGVVVLDSKTGASVVDVYGVFDAVAWLDDTRVLVVGRGTALVIDATGRATGGDVIETAFEVDGLGEWDSVRITASTVADGLLVCVTSSRLVIMFELATCSQVGLARAPGSGAPRTLAVVDGAVVVPSDNGSAGTVSLAGNPGLEEPSLGHAGPGVVFALAPCRDDLVLATEAGFGTVNGVGAQAPGLGLVACGVDVSPDGAWVAGADFRGNVCVWSRDGHTGRAAPSLWTEVGGSVRALRWAPDPTTLRLVVGTLDGTVLLWTLGHDDVPREALCVSGGVTALDWTRDGELVIGTTGGELTRASFSSTTGHNDELQVCARVMAHPPAKASQLFGSLGMFAEVWSVAVGELTCGKQVIATSSEDQTVRVFDAQSLNALAVLAGHHTLAVTAVAWVEPGVLVSVSDDRRACLYREHAGSGWSLVGTWTSDLAVPRWHTLTYVGVVVGQQQQQAQVVIGTQNGFLCGFHVPASLAVDVNDAGDDGDTRIVEWARRVHAGSVEGLVVWQDVVVTCSSDCSVRERAL